MLNVIKLTKSKWRVFAFFRKQNLSQTTGYINPVAALALQLQQVQHLAAATNQAALTSLGLGPAQSLPLFSPPTLTNGLPVSSHSHQNHTQGNQLSGNGTNGHAQNGANAGANNNPPITVATAGANQSSSATSTGPPISLCNSSAAALSAALAANQQNNMALAAAALVAGAGLNGRLFENNYGIIKTFFIKI